jgi:hypothetical protein
MSDDHCARRCLKEASDAGGLQHPNRPRRDPQVLNHRQPRAGADQLVQEGPAAMPLLAKPGSGP